jgi:hypothetical protein
MQSNSIPSVEDIPFDVSPSGRVLLSEILMRLSALEEENKALREEIALERAYDRQRLARLENPIVSPSPPLEGTKTADRIEEMVAILKRQQGRAAFSDLKEELKLSDSQFSKLIKKLDMRRFDVQRHPHNGKEKILVLRQLIG